MADIQKKQNISLILMQLPPYNGRQPSQSAAAQGWQVSQADDWHHQKHHHLHSVYTWVTTLACSQEFQQNGFLAV